MNCNPSLADIPTSNWRQARMPECATRTRALKHGGKCVVSVRELFSGLWKLCRTVQGTWRDRIGTTTKPMVSWKFEGVDLCAKFVKCSLNYRAWKCIVETVLKVTNSKVQYKLTNISAIVISDFFFSNYSHDSAESSTMFGTWNDSSNLFT